MLEKLSKYILILIVFIFAGCSTTKVIPEGESRLKQNEIRILNSKIYQASELEPYVKQKTNTYFFWSWNPFISIYNWRNGKDKGWDRFVEKIGQAPVVFDPSLVTDSKKNILNHLTYQGYYNSSVKDSIVTKRKKTTVFYNINLGKQYIIDSVSWNIDSKNLSSAFYEDSLQKTISVNTPLSEQNLNDVSEKISKNLRDKGYYGFTKNYLFFTADTLERKGKASLTVDIKNYTRNGQPKDAKPHRVFKYGKVTIQELRKPSNPLVYTFVGDSVIAIPAMTLNTPNDSTIYRGINIQYRNRLLLRKGLVTRVNQVKPGMLYNEEQVANTYSRFTNLNMFSSVNIQMDQKDTNTVDCTIKLTASELQGYKVGLESSINSTGLFGISPSVSYYHKNLFGGAELFSINLMGDFQFGFNSNKKATEFGASTSISTPNFLLLPDNLFKSTTIPRTEYSISYNYQKRPEYTRNILSSSYSYVWNKNEKHFFKISPIQLNIVKLYNLKPDFYESLKDPFLINSYKDHFDLGLGTNYYFTTDSSPRPEHSYFYMRWQNDLSGNMLSLFNTLMPQNESGERLIWQSPYSQYYRTELTTVYTLRLGKKEKHSIAARFLGGVGWGYGNSVTLPFEKLFWAGGAYSLRGWQARTIGPGYAHIDKTFTIPNQTGDMRLEANLEYRYPLFWNFEGALFIDAGNVWNIKDNHDSDETREGLFNINNFYKHIAMDWGTGVRLDLSFVLLRLDMGIKLYDPAADDWKGPRSMLKKGNYTLQFGVGYPF